MIILSLPLFGQRKAESRPLTQLARYPNSSPVQLDEFLRERQPESCALDFVANNLRPAAVLTFTSGGFVASI